MAIRNRIIGSSESQTTVVNKYHSIFDIYIGRGSIWGNPYTIEEHGRDKAIALYQVYIIDQLDNEPELVKQLLLLKGKTLGCFCKPKPCHGDILVKLIDRYSNTTNPQ